MTMSQAPVPPVHEIQRAQARSSIRVRGLLLLLFVMLSVSSTWPLALNMGDSIPTGTEPSSSVPLLNQWTVWWNAERARAGFDGYWDAPIFYPATSTFAFSESQLTTLIVAPIQWYCGNVGGTCAYNIYLLLALTLNGVSGYQFGRAIGLSMTTAIFTGCACEILPFVHWQLGVLQLVPVCGILWTIAFLWRLIERPRWSTAIGLGLIAGTTYLACNYYGLMLGLLLVLTAPCLARGITMLRKRKSDEALEPKRTAGSPTGRRAVLMLLAAIAISAAVVSPVVVKQWQVFNEYDWQRRQHATLENLSAEPRDFLVPPWPQPFPELASPADRRTWRRLGIGSLKTTLAAIGLVFGLWTAGLRRKTLFLACLGVSSFMLAHGLRFEVFGLQIYEQFVMAIPGFEHARNIYRFAVFTQIALVGLAGIGLFAIECGVRAIVASSTRRSRVVSPQVVIPSGLFRRLVAPAVTVAVGAMAVGEVWPDRVMRVRNHAADSFCFHVPNSSSTPAWVEWIRDQTPADAAIACVPFSSGTTVFNYQRSVTWMYWSMHHNRRLLNGYSGQFPKPYIQLRNAMQDFPNPAVVERLIEMGADYCVVERSFATRKEVEDCAPALEFLFVDDQSGIDVYRLVRKR